MKKRDDLDFKEFEKILKEKLAHIESNIEQLRSELDSVGSDDGINDMEDLASLQSLSSKDNTLLSQQENELKDTETEAKKTKVAFALLWTIDDQGWTTAHYHGIEYLKAKLGDQIEISYTEKVLAADAERVFRNYAQQGYDIIFGTTFEHMDPMLNVAKDYPDIAFEHCSGFKTGPNMGNYFGRMYQARYLSGMVAGSMTKSNILGYAAAFPIPSLYIHNPSASMTIHDTP